MAEPRRIAIFGATSAIAQWVLFRTRL